MIGISSGGDTVATRLLGVLGILGGLVLLAAFVVDIPPPTSEANPTIFGPLSLFGIALVGVAWVLLGIDVAMAIPRPGWRRSPSFPERAALSGLASGPGLSPCSCLGSFARTAELAVDQDLAGARLP